MNRVITIGLDGATWNILMPLINEGKLPTFEKLLDGGVHGVLESTVPPVTGGAWLSMATGKTPRKTGIIDFLNRKNDSYNLYPTNSNDFKGLSLWDYLSKENKKVGIFNYPMLFPPYRINGFMVSGIGSHLNSNIFYPSSLKQELEQVANKYELYIDYHNPKYENLDLFLYDVSNLMDKVEKWIYYLIKNKDWDFLFTVFSSTDWIQHIMWRYVDKDHPLYDPKTSTKYKREFIKFWRRIDDILKEILNNIGDDTNVILVSDHGFGPNDQTFNLAKWLEIKGYLKRKRCIKRKLKKIVYNIAVKLAKTPIKKLFSLKVRKTIGNSLRASIIDEIDFDKSKAFCLGHTIPFGAIYINAKNEKERKKMKNRLIHDLENISDDIGKKVEVQIYELEKIYSGEKIQFLPDIIFTINNWRCVILEDTFNRPLFEEKPFSTRHTGSHRLNGIFIAYGPGIKKGWKIENAKIYDIAPTILHIFGLPIPNDMDGKVLTEIFEENSKFAKRKPKYVEPSYYEKKEEEKIRQLIKNLKSRGKI